VYREERGGSSKRGEEMLGARSGRKKKSTPGEQGQCGALRSQGEGGEKGAAGTGEESWEGTS